jgi:nucleoside-triphosphatase
VTRSIVTTKVLLTGRPGCGKTTLIKRIVEKLGRAAGGFYTAEIRARGTRVGFKVVTLDRKEAVFAHVNFKTTERVSKYGLDLTVLETVAVEALRDAMRSRRLVVIDEIGPMEIRSASFRTAVMEALDSGAPILGTIVARPLPFTDMIKSRPDVTLIEVGADNRERLVAELSAKFKPA